MKKCSIAEWVILLAVFALCLLYLSRGDRRDIALFVFGLIYLRLRTARNRK